MALRWIPWWAKIGAKIVLSRLPFDYGVWQRLGIFRHGRMDESDYALRVFELHLGRAGLTGKIGGKTVIELGPGDSIATALVAAASGARATLIDTARFAHTDIRRYVLLARSLATHGLPYLDVEQCRTIDEVLEVCRARYLTSGLDSLRCLPDSSADLIFSEAVLEHIRKNELPSTLAECRRVLQRGGVFSSQVDLQDHLGGALNNLRFPERLWESRFFSTSGFYTNRVRYGEFLKRFSDAGFAVEVVSLSKWQQLPTRREVIQPEFRSLSDDELLIHAFSVVLR